MSIRTKLTGALAAMLALLPAIGILGLVQLRAVQDVTHEIREVRLPQIETLQLIKHLAFEHKLLASRRMQTSNFHYLAAITSAMERTEQAMMSARDAFIATAEGEHDKLFLRFRMRWRDYLTSLDVVTRLTQAGESGAANDIFNTTATIAFDSVAQTIEHIIYLAREESTAAAAKIDKAFSLAFVLTIGAILMSLAVAISALIWITRNVSAPILKVADAMQRLTAGDDSVVLPDGHSSGDEIGVLLNAAAGYRHALMRSRDLAATAELEHQRLHAAVNNMPLGLSMFDRDERLVICNSVYRNMYDLNPEEVTPGTTLEEIIKYRSDHGHLHKEDLAAYRASLMNNISRQAPVMEVFEVRDGRSISMVIQPIDGGGWVALHEDITSRREAENRIRHMAHHDALTDLPNRLTLKAKIDEGLAGVAQDEHVAVLSLDLDRFKAVNDTLGHATGDTLLTIVAHRLRNCLRERDTVARFGGDEFAIVQIGTDQPAGATALGRRVIDSLSAPYSIDGVEVVIGCSVGIAIAPNDGTDAETLLKNSDLALYRAKNDGRGMYHFFEPTMDACMQARRRLELDLRKALVDSEFEMYYQPVVNLDRGEVTSLEALLRWHSPSRGMVSPADFIPLAEEIGLIIPLGEWVLKRSCLDAVRWPRDVTVSVNLSPSQFQSARLLDAVKTALDVSGLAPHRLELEITEGVLLAETEATLAILQQIHALGVHVAMDDFGTGYSGLSYFRSFRFDRIKIDRSFITNIASDENSLAIVRAVTGLSASLGMATTAEGVETDEQLQKLRAEGCKEFQGYLFSPPKPASEIHALLMSGRVRKESAA